MVSAEGGDRAAGSLGMSSLVIMLADDHMGWVCWRGEGTCGAGGSSDLQGRGDGGLDWATVEPEGVDGFGTALGSSDRTLLMGSV